MYVATPYGSVNMHQSACTPICLSAHAYVNPYYITCIYTNRSRPTCIHVRVHHITSIHTCMSIRADINKGIGRRYICCDIHTSIFR